MRRHSAEFKNAAVEKLLSRGTRTVASVAEEIGVSQPTLYLWKLGASKVGGMKKPSRPQDRSTAEKLKIVNEFEAALPEERGEVLRRLGVHREHVNAWAA